MKQVPIAEILTRFTIDPQTGCWIWNLGCNPAGYGVIQRGKPIKAHRFFYTHIIGPIPDGMVICHRCDNPPCVNPDHLFAGTHSDNQRDAMSKGRWKPQSGTENGFAKLNEDQVRRIRYHETGLQREIAERYGVAQTLVSAIRRREVWKDI